MASLARGSASRQDEAGLGDVANADVSTLDTLVARFIDAHDGLATFHTLLQRVASRRCSAFERSIGAHGCFSVVAIT
jgi:hypothetical protein